MDYFNYREGRYHAEDVPLEAIAAGVGTPCYVYSSATLERHYSVFAGSFEGADAMVCYAVKANPNLAILNTLARLGAGADVVSEGEIRCALAAGIAPQRIVFSGVGKTRAEMDFALQQNIFQFNVESLPELELLAKAAAKAGKRAAVALRVNPDVESGTHAKIATGHKESKFGIDMAAALDAYRIAASLPSLKVQGVSVHIGSQLTSLEPFAQAFAKVRELVAALRAQGHGIGVLDLGGGLGIPYGREEPPPPAAYADIVKRETQGMDCKLVFEPGRLIVGNAGILLTRVLYVKRGEERLYVIIDAGMNDLLRPALYGAYHDIVPVVVPGDAPTEMADIVGPVCETGDVLAEQRLMKLPQPGDLLAIRSAGAYGASMAGTYNSRPLVAEVMVKEKEWAVVRKRQGYEEMLAQYALPEWLCNSTVTNSS